MVFPADWEKFGKSAGYRRNFQMHEYIASFPKRECVCFWDGKSKGTAHNFKLAEDFNMKLEVFDTNTLSDYLNKYNRCKSFSNGDIFTSDAKCIVNPVNCVGVMGKGLALSFKKKYPEMFENYQEFCKDGLIKPGVCFLYHAADRDILNFPTKFHWKNPSEMEYIEKGLDWIVENKDRFESIAFPAIGCGLGGLEWSDVKSLILDKLGDTNIRLELYEPLGGDKDYLSKLLNAQERAKTKGYTNDISNDSLEF